MSTSKMAFQKRDLQALVAFADPKSRDFTGSIVFCPELGLAAAHDGEAMLVLLSKEVQGGNALLVDKLAGRCESQFALPVAFVERVVKSLSVKNCVTVQAMDGDATVEFFESTTKGGLWIPHKSMSHELSNNEWPDIRSLVPGYDASVGDVELEAFQVHPHDLVRVRQVGMAVASYGSFGVVLHLASIAKDGKRRLVCTSKTHRDMAPEDSSFPYAAQFVLPTLPASERFHIEQADARLGGQGPIGGAVQRIGTHRVVAPVATGKPARKSRTTQPKVAEVSPMDADLQLIKELEKAGMFVQAEEMRQALGLTWPMPSSDPAVVSSPTVPSMSAPSDADLELLAQLESSGMMDEAREFRAALGI